MPRYWRYHNISLAWEEKDVSNPKGSPPSTERTGPPSQGSQTVNSQSLPDGDSSLQFTGKASPWRLCWLCKEVWFLSFPGDPYSPLVSSAGTQLSQTSSPVARRLEEVQPPTASHPHLLAAVTTFCVVAAWEIVRPYCNLNQWRRSERGFLSFQ